MKGATRYANAIAQIENDSALEAVVKSGKTTVYTPNNKELAAWMRVMVPVEKEMEGRIGKDLIMAINKESKALGFD